MIETFLNTIAQTRSENMLNLAIIDALNWMTPGETFALYQVLMSPRWRFPGEVSDTQRRRFTEVTRAGVGQSFQYMQNAGKPATERYRRVVFGPGLSLFRGAREQAGRTLVVAFPGNGGRLMMPLPIILQHLPARDVDLLMVPDGHRMNYRKGIRGLAASVEEALPILKDLMPQGYARRVTFGTSSGGVPSLLAAAALGAETALAIGAGHPDDDRWNESVARSKRQLLETARPGLDGCAVTLAYGAESPDDALSAQAIATIVPHAEILPVAVPGVEVKHVALTPLVKTRQMAGFLVGRLGLADRSRSAAAPDAVETASQPGSV